MATGPLPVADPVTRPYWESLKAHAMRLQRCESCARWVFYPRAVCPHCGGVSLEWRDVSGRGTLYSYTVVHRAPSAELQAETPYLVGLVDLEEDVRLMGRLDGVGQEGVRIGMAVRVGYHDVTEEITLPRFVPGGVE